jgi:hypothetical protein
MTKSLFITPLAKVDFRPPSPPILGGEYIQSPPEWGDLGGIPGFMQEVYCDVGERLNPNLRQTQGYPNRLRIENLWRYLSSAGNFL